jgi:hypothetical protein
MNYGEVQGPINKEPEEKLDPNSKPAASSGIRRLYVVDYTTTKNNLNIELVVILKLDIECNSLNDAVAFANLPIQAPIPTKAISYNNNNKNNKIEANPERLSRNESNEISERSSRTDSFKLSLIILLLNIYYLFICLYMNKILVSLVNLSFNFDLIMAIVLLRVYKSIEYKKKFFSFKAFIDNCHLINRKTTLTLPTFFNTKNLPHFYYYFLTFIFTCVFVLFFICILFYLSNQV